MADIIHPDDLERVIKEVRAYSKGGADCFNQEYRIICKDGRIRWIYDFTVIIRNERKQITHYHGYVFDITPRREAEEALHESWAKYGEMYIASSDHKIEFMNRHLIERIGYDGTGQPCYKVLHDRDDVCPWCVDESVLRGKTVRWEIQDPKDKRWYYVVNTPIRHDDGTMSKMAMLEDITERKEADDLLKRREAILEAVGFASEQFMHTDGWSKSIRDVLARLGQATGVSRIYIFENHSGAENKVLTSIRYEWVAPGISSQVYNPILQAFSYEKRGFSRWQEVLSKGRVITGHVREFPRTEQEVLNAQGILSLVLVPIFVDKGWWGFIGLNSCDVERNWSPSELEALKTAAGLFGAAIHRTQYETALKNSEEKNRVILDAIPDLMFRIKKDGTYLDFKAENTGQLASEPDSIIGKTLHEILPKEVADEGMRHIAEAIRTGERQIQEYELPTIDGDTHQYEARIVVSAPDEVLVIVRDVTEKRKAENALREQQQRLSRIINFLPDATFAIDSKGRVIAWNRAIEIMTGVKADEIMGKGDYEYALPFYGVRRPVLVDLVLHADDATEKNYKYMERSGDTFFAEVDLPSIRDRSLVVWVTATPLYDAGGNIVGAIECIRDITARKQAEEAIKKLAAFPQFNPNAVLEFSSNGVLSYFNHAAKEMALSLGMEDPSEMLPPDATNIVEECFVRGIKKERIECAVGSRTLSWSFFPIPESKTVHAYGVDITERQNLEIQMRHLQKMEAVGRLAGGVAHDFNNILTAILGYSSMVLLDKTLPEEAVRQIQEITKSAERASHLTRQLLTFSRKQLLQPRTLNVNEVLTGLSDMLHRLISEDVPLIFDYGDELPVIYADQSMIEQVMVNMVINARDAMPEGGKITIATSVSEVDADHVRNNPEARTGRFVKISVSDTGCGMDEEVKARIFEPFFTTKSEGEGTGLGLATVYGIVKQHNGWIEVSSEVGRGAIFAIHLPIHSESAESDKTRDVHRTIVNGGDETILVVEDEKTVRILASSILTQYGYKVLEASSGIEGINVWEAEQGHIDLLLTDVVMPGGLTGNELADRLHERKKDLKVILTSGYNMESGEQKFTIREGMKFLPKPFSPADLAKAVREMLDR